MTRAELRAQAFHRAGDQCEWTSCYQEADELAHLHSIGMGGRKSADSLDNVAALCEKHARFSDGDTAGHSLAEYRQAHIDLFGGRFLEIPAHLIAYERAETLRALIGETT